MWLKSLAVNSIPGRMIRLFGSRYVAGDSLERALEVADALYSERGIESTLDVLGESEETKDKVEKTIGLYLHAIETLEKRPYCSLSVKPGSFGYCVDQDYARSNMDKLASASQSAGREMTIDMEDTDLTDFTLDLYRELKPKYPLLGIVLQTRLFRTQADADTLKGLKARVRACIGIYNVSSDKAMQKKRDMKEKLLELIEKLFDDDHYVCIATHDLEYLEKARKIITDKKIPGDRYEFQMLLGIPRAGIQDKLVSEGERVRFYVPFAESWDDALAYLRRRMYANPSMSALVFKNLFTRK